MSSDSIHQLMGKFFSGCGRKDWLEVATQELHGKDPEENLAWRGKDGILFSPFYDAENAAHRSAADTTGIAAAGAHEWINLPEVALSNEHTANTEAISHLESGADGILFNLTAPVAPDLPALLRKLVRPDVTLAFRINDHRAFAQILDFLAATPDDTTPRKMLLFVDSAPAKEGKRLLASPAAISVGLAVPETTPAEEISEALLRGANAVEGLRDETDIRNVFSRISFSISTDARLAETVAKFRALRMLWREVAIIYGHHDYKLKDLHLHARLAKTGDGAYGPHENMLKGTFASIAAVCGGCDSLTVECEAEPPFVPRQARNISTILRQEAFFARVSDPFAGAYAVEAITHSIAGKAWQLFQHKWSTA